jgi:hypothetical protein
MTDDDVKREFYERVIGKAETQREAFTNAVIEQIGAEFNSNRPIVTACPVAL